MHGARGEDPTEPPASAPYPFPAVSHEPRIQQLSDDLAKAGLHPFHAPCGVMLDEANMPFSTCMRCDNCDGFPCIVHAKSDAEVLGVRPALEHPNVELLDRRRGGPAAHQRRRDRASPASWSSHDGASETSAATSSSSPAAPPTRRRLLLMSATDSHPDGLANGSDQVGRNYMFHNSQAVLALSKEENPTIFQKTLGLNDFYFSGPDFEFPMGNIQMVGKSQAADVPRREAGRDAVRPELDAATTWRGTRSTSGSRPRTCRGPRTGSRSTDDGTITIATRPSNEEAKERLYEQAQVDARRTSACTTTTCCPTTPT